MVREPSPPSIGTAHACISSKERCLEARRRLDCSSSQCYSSMKKASRFAIAPTTRPVTPTAGNFHRLRRQATDQMFREQEDSMLVRSLTVAALCAAFTVLPVQAHHSHGNYDVATWTTMDGTVKELHLLVPHSWIYLDVKDSKGE